MEQESTEYSYSIVLDILAEMVTNYIAMHEHEESEKEEKWSDKHAN